MKRPFTALATTMLAALHAAGAPLSSGRWVAFSEKPAVAWEDAFVTGNGRHGTHATGMPGSERVICVHEELFIRGCDRKTVAVPDIAELMPEVRKLCSEGKMQQAANLACGEARRQLSALGAPQIWPVCPHPAFDLNLKTALAGAPTGFRRQLDMETGETRSAWQDTAGGVEQSVFSSRTVNANVIRLKATGGRKLDVVLGLDETPGRAGVKYDLDIGGGIRSVKSEASPGRLDYHAHYGRDNGGYEGLARVTTKGGSMITENGRIHVKAADEILVVLRITPLADGTKTARDTVWKELKALPIDYDTLLAPHAKKHGEMFRRVTLDMGCAEAWKTTSVEKLLAEAHANGPSALFYEMMHASGRNLLISSSGKYPPPLQGIWGGSWKPEWIGGFVLDTNLNLAISNMSIGDLPECAASYFQYIEHVLPGWRLNAKRYLGCRGFLVPHYSDPETGYLTHFINEYPWMYWPAGAGWNIMPLYEHAMITGDGELLRKRVLPLYREMADFYEDYLTKGADGRLHIIPSISPENFTKGSLLTRDATMDVAVAREVYDHLLKMGELLKLDPEDMAKWKAARDAMPAYRINADGALAEWCDPAFPDLYAHRHSSHLYPVFPGTEFLRPGADPALLKATQVALDKRFATDTDSAHGLIHIALMAARIHDTAKIAGNLDRFSRRNYVYGGLVTSHNPNHEIYNLDSILSLPRLMAEMVAFSQPGRLELLPALPPQYPAGKLSGIRIHGGHKLDVTWKDGKLAAATLHAGKDGKLTIVSGSSTKTLEIKAGRDYPCGF
ncbi:MAG TPA: glycoside hydrolase N-terminal domain-containing protein [Luteolibacter sp.]